MFAYRPYLTFTVAFRCVDPSPEVFFIILREIPSGRGEGPSYMKVPYTYPPFQVTSSHHSTVFGVGGVRIGRGHENVFICICTSVSMNVLSRSSKTLYGLLKGKECMENSQFWYLKTLELGLNLDKNKVCILSESGRKWHKSLGDIQNTF